MPPHCQNTINTAIIIKRIYIRLRLQRAVDAELHDHIFGKLEGFLEIIICFVLLFVFVFFLFSLIFSLSLASHHYAEGTLFWINGDITLRLESVYDLLKATLVCRYPSQTTADPVSVGDADTNSLTDLRLPLRLFFMFSLFSILPN